ncbi:MAG: hypothetical protein GF311_12795 [Candidatus Lokiarchaeota archaeon]|nr:hypothetical protein [Candidatus Lokiarchaeota archaeon]
MNEADVVFVICDHLNEEKWNIWIDDHPIHRDLKYRNNSFLIGGDSSRPNF